MLYQLRPVPYTYSTPGIEAIGNQVRELHQFALVCHSTHSGFVESSRTTIHAHENGIFDVKWNKLDTLLATASGDQSTRILCPRTSSCLHTLRGHSSTAKCVAWDPNHQDLLSTGGRDGPICLWDLRVAESRNGDFLAPIFKIDNAQRDVNEKKPRGRKPKMQPILPSITSILYPEMEPYQLISSGSADGSVDFRVSDRCY